jgi:hypothetical protein
MGGSAMTFTHESPRLSYAEACRISRLAMAAVGQAKTIYVRLEQTSDAPTAALARLVCLRACLLKRARDLRIVGLRGRALARYELCRLERVLPRVELAESARAASAESVAARADRKLLTVDADPGSTCLALAVSAKRQTD